MFKNLKILIITILVLVIAVAVWYVNKNQGDNNQEEIAFSTGFTLLDDAAGLINGEAVELAPEVRAEFEKRAEEAKADLLSATDKEVRLADYNNLAIYEKYLGNYKEAYDAYLQSLNLESQARVTWQNFADVLLKMKAFKSAEKAYKKAIELNKYIPESYLKLADYYKSMGDFINIEATYKTALETIKESTESDTLVLDAYAEWLGLQKRYDEAIGFYRQLMAKQPNNRAAIEKKIEELRKKIQ